MSLHAAYRIMHPRHQCLVSAIAMSVLASSVALAMAAAQAQAGTVLQRISERGVKVCTNTENRPFAYMSPSGGAQGFNIDLAEDIRMRLSAELGLPLRREIIATSGANRVPFLDQGKCDVIITGYTVTPERQRLVDFIQPNFYSSGAVLLARKDHPVESWESLRGKTVCSSHGSTYNQALAERYGVRILAFAGLTESARALRDQRCVGQVMDEVVARLRLVNQREWAQFDIMLPSILEAPWSMAIARSLCMQPEVMLFAEVTAALDLETVKEVLTVIQDIAAEGMTCVLVTHEMRFAQEIGDYVYLMDEGRVVEHARAEELFAAPRDPRTRSFLDKVL